MPIKPVGGVAKVGRYGASRGAVRLLLKNNKILVSLSQNCPFKRLYSEPTELSSISTFCQLEKSNNTQPVPEDNDGEVSFEHLWR